jgi:hypothetical protein
MTVRLIRYVSLQNDDGYAFGTSQTIETFTIQNSKEKECRMKHAHAQAHAATVWIASADDGTHRSNRCSDYRGSA